MNRHEYLQGCSCGHSWDEHYHDGCALRFCRCPSPTRYVTDRTAEPNDLAGAEERSKPALVPEKPLGGSGEVGSAQVGGANANTSCGAATDS